MLRRLTIIFLLIFSVFPGISQDIRYARYLINALASDSMYGRGYQHEGDIRAAEFIRQAFQQNGLHYFDTGYFQGVVFPVNSITGATFCEIDGVIVEPGKDYFISARSKGREETYRLVWLDHKSAQRTGKMRRFYKRNLSKSLVMVDPKIITDSETRSIYRNLFWGERSAFSRPPAGMVWITEKPGWYLSDSGGESDYVVVTMRDGAVTKKSRKLELKFTSHFEPEYTSHNVIGYIPGRLYPDSFIVYTAHYDHLGMMGKVIIPGANDNASGTAMIIDLARHYSVNPPAYSVAFMAFTGEEAGLLGSSHYVSSPFFPLENIRVLINLDMVGSGSEGITLVNGSIFKEDFAVIDSLNSVHSFLSQVKARGESANSDHYPFFAKGVTSFFIYTMGDEFREYHNIYDRPESLPLTRYEELFRLLTTYTDHIMRSGWER